jgi:hypothetical protein
MRAVLALPVLMLAACGDDLTPTAPVSMRDRLATETPLFITASASAGAITAQMRTSTGWDDGLVDLKLAGGELVARAGAGGGISLTALSLELETITIPASLTGHAAELTRPHLQLAAPVELSATWTGDDAAQAEAALPVELSWALTVDGVGLPLGAPSLPPLPMKLQLSGDGSRVTAELRVHAPGELWSWADLIKLSDLELVLGADAPAR